MFFANPTRNCSRRPIRFYFWCVGSRQHNFNLVLDLGDLESIKQKSKESTHIMTWITSNLAKPFLLNYLIKSLF